MSVKFYVTLFRFSRMRSAQWWGRCGLYYLICGIGNKLSCTWMARRKVRLWFCLSRKYRMKIILKISATSPGIGDQNRSVKLSRRCRITWPESVNRGHSIPSYGISKFKDHSELLTMEHDHKIDGWHIYDAFTEICHKSRLDLMTIHV